MPFDEQTRVDPRNHILAGSAYWRHLTNAIDRSARGDDAMRPCVKLLYIDQLSIVSITAIKCNLDDLEELDGLNGDVELDEAVGGTWTQLFAIYRPQRADDSRLLVNVEPPIGPRHASCSHTNAQSRLHHMT